MSYGLRLAFTRRPTVMLIRAAAESAGLRLVGTANRSNGIRDDDRLMFIDIDGPHEILEPEDIDDELMAAVPHARWAMNISRPAAAGDDGLRVAMPRSLLLLHSDYSTHIFAWPADARGE